MHYLALVYTNDEGGYGFTVPDIEGFTADAGEAGLDDALAVARRILADHIAALVDAGLAIPAARRPEDVLNDPEFTEDIDGAIATTLLPAIMPAGRTLRINITMDESTLRIVDSAATDRGLTRSAFIAEAARRLAVGEPIAAARADRFVARMEEEARHLSQRLHDAAGTGGIFAAGRRKRTS